MQMKSLLLFMTAGFVLVLFVSDPASSQVVPPDVRNINPNALINRLREQLDQANIGKAVAEVQRDEAAAREAAAYKKLNDTIEYARKCGGGPGCWDPIHAPAASSDKK